MPQASDIFLTAASICVVLLTIAAIVAAYMVIRAAQEVRELVHTVREETERAILWRRRIQKGAGMLGKWLKFMALSFINYE